MKIVQKHRGKWGRSLPVSIAVTISLLAIASTAQALDLDGTTELSADADVNGDGKTDFCQIKNQGDRRGQIVCLTVELDAPRFTASDLFISPQIDLGFSTLPRGFADVNGDKRADYCRVAGFGTADRMYLACNLAGSTGFGTDQYQFKSISGIDLGYANLPKGFADVNGDGKADFCRVVGGMTKNRWSAYSYGQTVLRDRYLACALAEANGFSANQYQFKSIRAIDLGDANFPRGFADVNGDGKADFCRIVGGYPTSQYVACNLAEANGFGINQYQFKSISAIDLTYASRYWWLTDVNGDEKADFCRYVKTWEWEDILGIGCNLAEADGFGAYFLFQPIASNLSEDQKRSLMDLIVKTIVTSPASKLD